jgi:hypothetical protein
VHADQAGGAGEPLGEHPRQRAGAAADIEHAGRVGATLRATCALRVTTIRWNSARQFWS